MIEVKRKGENEFLVVVRKENQEPNILSLSTKSTTIG